MILKLENTTTHQIYEYEVKDMNNGEKLYFRFDIDTSDLVDGEYVLSLYDGEKLVANDLLKIGDYNPSTLQYKKGENTYINVTLDNSVQDVKSVSIATIETTVYPDEEYNSISKVEVNAQPLYDNAYHIGHTEGYNEGLESSYQVGYDDGYSIGNEEGYNNGYNVGNADGIEEGKANQKALLEPITITENGTYSREDGYNSIEVNVPDVNGSYDEGYSDGYLMGEDKGYDKGYTDGIEEGTSNAGSIIAETARVLNITENGTYLSRYSEPPTPDVITGVFDDGTVFANYAELNGKVFDTKIPATPTTRLEMWYKGDNIKKGDGYNLIIGAGKKDDRNVYQIRYDSSRNDRIRVELGKNVLYYTWDENAWHHILIAKETEDTTILSLWIDEVKIGDFGDTPFNTDSTFYINGIEYALSWGRNANGCFGMVKIDDQTFIPTADGFRNTNTGELLEVAEEGGYAFTDNTPIVPEGNLIKTVNVNVQPKINVAEAGVKFGYSSFETIPEWVDFEGVTNMSYMFEYSRLKTLKGIDFSNVIDMSYAFYFCTNLTNLDYFTPSKLLKSMYDTFYGCNGLKIIPNMDLSSVLNADSLFESCSNIEEIGDINFENATNISGFLKQSGNKHNIRKIGVFNVPNLEKINDFFYYSFSPVIRENLIEMGGFIGLKCNWDGGCGLDSCPNLTYQSCINILNGLADVTELGGRTLKVHQNFLTTVGDEISIGTNKGWVITA